VRGTLLIAVLLSLASCSTSQQTTQTSTRTDTLASIEPRLIFGFTSSGIGTRPSDGIRLDSSGQMTYITRWRTGPEEFNSLTGMAFLEAKDYSDLLAIVKRGNLTNMDSSDVGVKCPQGQGEMISLVMRMTDQKRAVNLIFDECATDFNLLLESQRGPFKELINWFNFARQKYRPRKP